MSEAVMPCLMCDAPVTVDIEDWNSTEAPFVLCERCAVPVDCGQIPWPMVKVIYVVRNQVGMLFTKMELVDRNFKRLFDAQRDMEQALLKR